MAVVSSFVVVVEDVAVAAPGVEREAGPVPVADLVAPRQAQVGDVEDGRGVAGAVRSDLVPGVEPVGRPVGPLDVPVDGDPDPVPEEPVGHGDRPSVLPERPALRSPRSFPVWTKNLWAQRPSPRYTEDVC